jgi:FixJ family two-component response regulator
MSVTSPVIHVVDDDDDFRRAVGRVLQAGGYHTVLHATAESLLQSSLDTGPGCILLDLQMAGIGGLEVQARLKAEGDLLPIVFLTGTGDIPTSVQALKAGAEDFLCKPVPKDVLFQAVDAALKRYADSRSAREQMVSLRALISRLTPREREVFDLVVRGKLNKQIAFELSTAERTIKAHRHSIVEKLQVRSSAELASIAERLGILPGAST